MSAIDVGAFSLEQLRGHRSTKWRDFPSDVLPLPVAEMDFPVAEPITNLLLEMIRESDLGYLGPIPELPLAFAAYSEKYMNWNVDPAQVHIVTDVGVGVVEVLRLLTSPGDKVLVSSPVYHNFSTWIEELKLKKVDVPFGDDGTNWTIDFSGLEDAYKAGVSVHLLCNPHNPLGRLYSKEELLRIADLADEYDVTVISDEIHGPLTFGEKIFVPFLSLGEVAQRVAVTVTAASKTWNIAGLKCAVVVSQGEKMDTLLKKLPPATHYRASLLGAFASTIAYSEGIVWLEAIMRNLDSNRHFLATLLAKRIPEIKYRIPENSYLAWLDLNGLNLGENPSRVFLEKGKVAILDGRGFGPSGRGFARLNFATSPEILTEAVDRMVVAIS